MNKLVTSPRHDKLCQQVSKFYAICTGVSVYFALRTSARLSYGGRHYQDSLQRGAPTMHRSIVLRAYQTEKRLYRMYHFELGIKDAKLSHRVVCLPAHAR